MLLKRFVRKDTATEAAIEAKVNRHTANLYFNHFRECISNAYDRAPRLEGEVEMDQSYFGKGIKRSRQDRRVEERRRQYGAEWTTNFRRSGHRRKRDNHVLVFGILQRRGKVYTQVIQKADRRTLFPIIHLVVEGGTTVYTDRWQGFNDLNIDGYIHKPVNHSEGPVGRDGAHTGGIDSFWGFSKGLLMRFRGISRRTFALHLKECEFRWNYRDEKEMTRILKKIT